MSDRSDSLEDLVRRSARVRDEDLVPFADTPAAGALLEEIISVPSGGANAQPQPATKRPIVNLVWGRARGRGTRHRVRNVAIAAALVFAVVMSVPAFGVAQHIKSWLSDLKGSDNPVATAPDVVIASGVDGQPWTIVATQTDKGLCLFLLTQQFEERAGLGGCGWGSDIRGYGSANDLHWVAGGNGSGGVAALDRVITYGVTTENVASVDLELSNGRTIAGHLVVRPDGIDAPLNFFWAALGPQEGVKLSEDGGVLEPELPLVHSLVARDSAGNLLERRIVDGSHG